MKKIIILLIAMAICSFIHAQSVKIDKNGNYYAVSNGGFKKAPAIALGKTYTDTKGNIYPIYKNSKGKLFILKVSKKTNKEYRSYLKLEGS